MDTILSVLEVLSVRDIICARGRARRAACLLLFDKQSKIKMSAVVYELARIFFHYSEKPRIEYYLSQSSRQQVLNIKLTGSRLQEQKINEIEKLKDFLDKYNFSFSARSAHVVVGMNLPTDIPLINSAEIAHIISEIKLYSAPHGPEKVHLLNNELLAVMSENRLFSQQIKDLESQREWLYERQQDIARVERNRSLGEMSTALAHELNQPLAAVGAYIQGAMRYLKNNVYKKKELLDVMKHAVTQTQRAGKIIHRMNNAMSKNKISREKVDINSSIKNMLLLISHDFKKYHAQFSAELDDFLPPVYINRAQFKQALMSIIRNLLEEMRCAKVASPLITIKSFLKNKDEVEIDISDNGSRFKTQDSVQLFEPHFMPEKNDFGIGFSMARTIIHDHGGTLSVYPQASHGVRFQCILPVKQGQNK